MTNVFTAAELTPPVAKRAEELFLRHQQHLMARTDQRFARLMVVQWIAGVAVALWISPRTWAGEQSMVHAHVLAAVFLGALISLPPLLLVRRRPGEAGTRHALAVSQMLMGALFIHLSGGRIETHFHVFGSLAFLAFYRDWRVLATASAVVVVDHVVRGIYWPASVYGVASAPLWRAIEHGGWVLFEDFFLVLAIRHSVNESRDLAARHAQLESEHAQLTALNATVEAKVVERTAELAAKNDELTQALADVKELGGLLPVCSYCKKVRDDGDYWRSVENYVVTHTKARFSHGICPTCESTVVKPEMERLRKSLGLPDEPGSHRRGLD